MASPTHAPEINQGILTLWLPITTSWPAPPECSTAIYSQLGVGGVAIAYDPFYGSLIDTSLTCHPTPVTIWWNGEGTVSPQTVKSLGPFECNGDYTTATTSKVNDQTTFIACCPSNYNFQFTTAIGKLGQCNSPLTSGQPFTYMSILNFNNDNFRRFTTTIQSQASVYAVHVNGYVFADSTSASPTTASKVSTKNLGGGGVTNTRTTLTTITSGGTTQTTVITLESSNPSPSTINAAQPLGLSTGAKAGIGIGVGLSVLGCLALALAFFSIRRYRQRVATSSEETTATASGMGNTPNPVAREPWNEAIGGAFAPGINGNPPMTQPAKAPWNEAIGGAFAPGVNGNSPTRAQLQQWEAQRREVAAGSRHEVGLAQHERVFEMGTGEGPQRTLE